MLQDILVFRRQTFPVERVQEGEEGAPQLRTSMWLVLRRKMASESLHFMMHHLGAELS